MKRNNKTVSYALCCWLMLLVFGMQFAVSFCAKSLWEILSTQPLRQYDYIMLTQILAILLPCILMCLYSRSGVKKTFGFKRLSFYRLWNCVGLGICIQPAAILLNMPLHNLMGTQGTPVPPPNTLNDVLSMLLFVCLIPAFCEELLIRGMVLSSVKRKGYTFSIVVTTVMFVLMHCEPASVLGHILLGIVTAFAVLNTGSVFGGMLVHFSFNACGVLIDYITNKYYVQGGFLGSYECFAFLGIAGALLSLLFFKGVYSKKIKKYTSQDMPYKLWKAFFNLPVIVIIAVYILYAVL